ncbi:diaminopimelate dehydrogenase [Pseudothermotoga thermarum]|uniref:Meso-diaminopimelate D-dehydrogenase n=1 Tax=Pseudothermotoga thermarum DSM 5069 TaxID=688269 RepID=F7YTT4_9THEM|nr:diaminopimelate dehydrogenase [Pseudothermotoga thermarum]AEH51379.1 diaminopimelate dehydrogenase [Pseudothermotoga thermarum DSM 5069]
MPKTKVLVVGCGRVGKEVVTAVQESPDMELVGIVEQPHVVNDLRKKIKDIPVVTFEQVKELGNVDVAILAIGSRLIPEVAPLYLKMGMNTVDAYDIHAEGIVRLRRNLDVVAKENKVVAVIAAGWDPGTDSIVRALMEVIAPRGITYTNFGPGMSMGHTVAVKAIEGVEDAISITIPKGMGQHKRVVYVRVKDGYEFEKVAEKILSDPYFSHDETYVYKVNDVSSLVDMGHGVKIERKGVSASAHNQRMEFTMSINNPAATAQVMVAAARASLKQKPGCYTLLEIPLIDFLCGDLEQLICRLV